MDTVKMQALKDLARKKALEDRTWFPVDANTVRFSRTRETSIHFRSLWPSDTYQQHVFLRFTDTKVFLEVSRAPWVRNSTSQISLKKAAQTLEHPEQAL